MLFFSFFFLFFSGFPIPYFGVSVFRIFRVFVYVFPVPYFRLRLSDSVFPIPCVRVPFFTNTESETRNRKHVSGNTDSVFAVKCFRFRVCG